MLTKANIKHVQELHEKKYRDKLGLFLVEGGKRVAELLESDFTIVALFVSRDFFDAHELLIKKKKCDYDIVEQGELEKLSTLGANNAAVAIVEQKKNTPLVAKPNEIVLALDTIRDPANLGAIIRIADWYGINNIVASETATELYNPKTIAASMGSFARVHFFYTKLDEFLRNVNIPILGAFLEGASVHETEFPAGGILVVGNEANGISPSLTSIITTKITIPKFGDAESLNVSVATAVILDNWKQVSRFPLLKRRGLG